MIDRNETFWAKVEPEPTSGCWLWIGAKNNQGYGHFSAGPKKIVQASRWAYEQFRGPVPAHLEPDHVCHNRACVNPSHLELVTHQENCRRVERKPVALLTHCRRGHPYNNENRRWFRRGMRFYSQCATCAAIKRGQTDPGIGKILTLLHRGPARLKP